MPNGLLIQTKAGGTNSRYPDKGIAGVRPFGKGEYGMDILGVVSGSP